MEQPLPTIPIEEGFASEAKHFRLCRRCGQYLDERDASQVRHHQRLSHRPLTFDD